jgi:hypothetical protein
MKLRHQTAQARKREIEKAREAAPITPTMSKMERATVTQTAMDEVWCAFEGGLIPGSGPFGHAYPTWLGYEHIYTPHPVPIVSLLNPNFDYGHIRRVAAKRHVRDVLQSYTDKTLPAYEHELVGVGDRTTARALGVVVSLDRQFVELQAAQWQSDTLDDLGVADFHEWSVFAWLWRIRQLLIRVPASRYQELEEGKTIALERPSGRRWAQQLGGVQTHHPLLTIHRANPRLTLQKINHDVLGDWLRGRPVPVAYVPLPELDRRGAKIYMVAAHDGLPGEPAPRLNWYLCRVTTYGNHRWTELSREGLFPAQNCTVFTRMIYTHLGLSWSRLHRPCRYRRDTPDPYPRQRETWLSRWRDPESTFMARGDGNLSGIFGPNDEGAFIRPSGYVQQWSVVRALHQKRTVTALVAAARDAAADGTTELLLWDNKGAIGWVPRSAVEGVLHSIDAVGQQLHAGTLSTQLESHEPTRRWWENMHQERQ